jgi:two-component system chemotaxis response regulator CheY
MANIMLVDDSKFMRELLKKFLVAKHTIVGEADDGTVAVDRFDEWNPDVILMDVVMPHMDGITATRHIVRAHPGAKVIMCTSVGQDEKVKAAIEAGVVGYITKPF